MRILLAEDEVELSRALVAILKYSGYETDAAFNGEDAYHMALANHYDAFILDIMMPKLSGLEVLQGLRNRNIKTPVIMLTARVENKDKIRGLDLGADDYLAKPFQTNELLARLRALLRRNTDYLKKNYTFSDVTLNRTDNTLGNDKASFSLNHKETILLEALMPETQGKVSKKQLIQYLELEEEDNVDSRIEVYIAYINNKFQALSSTLRINKDREQSYRLEICNG